MIARYINLKNTEFYNSYHGMTNKIRISKSKKDLLPKNKDNEWINQELAGCKFKDERLGCEWRELQLQKIKMKMLYPLHLHPALVLVTDIARICRKDSYLVNGY